MKQLLFFLSYGILLSSVQTQSQPQWVADFGSGVVKGNDHVHAENASHKTFQSTSAKILGDNKTEVTLLQGKAARRDPSKQETLKNSVRHYAGNVKLKDPKTSFHKDGTSTTTARTTTAMYDSARKTNIPSLDTNPRSSNIKVNMPRLDLFAFGPGLMFRPQESFQKSTTTAPVVETMPTDVTKQVNSSQERLNTASGREEPAHADTQNSTKPPLKRVDPKISGNTDKPDVQNLLSNPNELPPPPPATRREPSIFEPIDSRQPPVSSADTVRERKLQQLQFIMGKDVPRAKLEALLDVFGSDSPSSQSQPTRPPPPPPQRNAPNLPPRERQERPSSNGWPSTPPPPREPRGPFRRQEPRVDPFLSSDPTSSIIPPPPGSANRGQRPSRGFNREFTSPTQSPPSFDGPPQGRVDMDARRQDMIERRLQQEQAKNNQESNLQMLRTLRALTRQRARTPAAEAPEQPEPGAMNPLLMAALFSGMSGGGEAGSMGLAGGLGGLLGGGGDLASLLAMQRGGSAAGETSMGGLGGGLSSLLGGNGGGMGGLSNMLGLGMGGLGGLGGTSATDTTGLGSVTAFPPTSDGLGKSNTSALIARNFPAPPLGMSTATHVGTWLVQDQVHDHPVKPTTVPEKAVTAPVSNEMTVVKTGQISQARLSKTTVAPKPMVVNVADHHQSNLHDHPVQTPTDPVMFLDVNNQLHDHPVPQSNSLGPDVRANMIEHSSKEMLPTLLDSTGKKESPNNLTLQEPSSTIVPSAKTIRMLVGIRRKGIQNPTGENTSTTLGLSNQMNVSSSQNTDHLYMLQKTPNGGLGGNLGSHSQSSFGSMQNNHKTTVPPPAPPTVAMDIHGQIHDHPIGHELAGHAGGHGGHNDHTAGHGQQSGNRGLAGRANQSSGNPNTNNPSSGTGVQSDLAALLQMQMGAQGSRASNNEIGMGGLSSMAQMMSMIGRGGGSSGTGRSGNTGAVTTSLEMMSLVPGLTLDQMSDLLGSYRGPIPREILVQAQALSRAGQSGDQIADVLGDVMQQWVRQQGLAANAGFSAGSTGMV